MADARELAPRDFTEFYEGIHGGRRPYKWQIRAAAELCKSRIWKALSAPTSSGKTTLIECFLFALAYTAGEGRSRLPLRLFWVIDRRSVVDQVHLHARTVVKAIEGQSSAVVGVVHERLAMLAGAGGPDGGAESAVQVRLWRGGLAGEGATTGHVPLSPCAPAVICTTVDQIGSRMLFRGYGVSRRSRPIEAALTATDSLIVLDEAHLSGPFRQTANAIRQAQEATGGQPVMPLHGLPISATLEHTDEDAFELTEKERAEPALARRLNASKSVELQPGKDHVQGCVIEARRLESEGVGVVAVIANTVATARSITTELRRYGEVVLLIGPVRPLDRAGLLDRIPPREERTQRGTIFVVATQTIEVGVDLDFDAVVTACAPFPSLVQRFGRLDRAGEMGGTARGVIVEPPKECPVYGEFTARTWEWLRDIATDGRIDLGPTAIERLLAEHAPPPSPDEPQAPVLGPWHLELLTQTSYDPSPDPDVAVFLHGERALDAADVQICWRADLDDSAVDPGVEWVERVRARPPHPGELLSLSPAAASRWLRQMDVTDMADVESTAEGRSPSTSERVVKKPDRLAIRVGPPGSDGMTNVEAIGLGSVWLRPGDLIVVPSSYGGCDEFGWAPKVKEPVHDLGNLASERPRILLSPSSAMPDELRAHDELRHIVEDVLARLDAEDLTEEDAFDELLPEIASWLESGGGFEAKGPLAVEAGRLGAQLKGTFGRSDEASDTRRGRAMPVGANRASGLADLLVVPPPSAARRSYGHRILYEDHIGRVAARACSFAEHLLSEEMVPTVTLAARNHDTGKLDPRFQAWLNNGNALDGRAPLAKSGSEPGGRRSREAMKVAGWPPGKRHESTSAALVAAVATSAWPKGVNRDLLIHLVATHHGYGRPFRSATIDAEPVDVEAQIVTDPFNGTHAAVSVRSDDEVRWSEHVERFVELNERFGSWGLAMLEAILVLADRAVSAEEGE